MMSSSLYAHSLKDHPQSEWETLAVHAEAVARTSTMFAARFGAGEWGAVAGWLHDLGKAKPRFQRRLSGEPISEPHAAEGAKAAVARFGPLMGSLLAPGIAGHHAGLPNAQEPARVKPVTPLNDRLRDAVALDLPKDWPVLQTLPLPALLAGALPGGYVPGFFARMLFSCLTDADSLETERFYAGAGEADAMAKAALRGSAVDLPSLRDALDTHLAALSGGSGEVNALRARVLEAARAAALQEPGLFSLTVPTGGGKTLSSLAFALDHAIAHGLDRVIYVIPFTSIVEQTAAVFRDAFGQDDAILEHHSAFDPDKEDTTDNDERRDGRERHGLAVENWDRPIIVTTAVQFFESLYANRKARCRKLHRLARSVIVLDEAQTIPPPVLRPCLAGIKELARGYGASLVLCTATQPAVTDERLTQWSDSKFEHVPIPEAIPTTALREIAPEREQLYEALKRVTVEHAGTLDDAGLVTRMTAERQVLCILNNRRHAREVFEMLPEVGRMHLSTAMVPAHRRTRLAKARRRLAEGQVLRLVSTSLIEAGVDVDFPAVIRAEAGIDSIAQAAGRCNREGKLGREGGRVTVFAPEEGEGRAPPPDLKQFADVGRTVMRDHADPLSLAAVTAYFEQLYWRRGADKLDAKGVMALCDSYETRHGWGGKFADIAEAFRMIEQTMRPVIVPYRASEAYGAHPDVMAALENPFQPVGPLLRPLQQHIVQVPRRARAALLAEGAAQIVREKDYGDQFVVLANADLYNEDRGLDWSDPTWRSAESNIF